MTNLSLYLLGPVRAKLNKKNVEVKPRKALALLIYLAVTAERQARDSLATLLWPESNQRLARHALRGRLSELNLTLGGNWIEADRESIGLRAGLALDVAEFKRLLSQKASDPQPLITAVNLYRDDFLTGFTLPGCPQFDEWQYFQSESLRQSLASVLEGLIGLLSDRGDYEAAIPYARRWLSLDPLHEAAHRQLMQLYAQSGQPAAALRQYERCRQTLADELGISASPKTTSLYNDIRAGRLTATTIISPAPLLPRSSAPSRHNLPAQSTPFIGRTRELADLSRLLKDPAIRLVTILAPGGMGKTRLARAAAEQHLSEFTDGVFFVPLAPLRAASGIVTAIAENIGYSFYGENPPAQQLMDFLQDRSLLLVLDNFEHLLNGAPLVADILRTTPEMRVLATSRERLNLHGETVFSLDGLAIPEANPVDLSGTPEDAPEYDAVTLFIQSARRACPDFELRPGDLDYLTRICRRTAGMPLAIELAASWADVLSLAQIAAELQQGIDILETDMRDLPARHRSIRVTFEGTWERLSDDERAIFGKLSVFRAGFTLAAAQTVAGANARHLRGLAHKALIQWESNQRFTVHELLRQFGASKLAEMGQLLAIQARHAAYFTDFMAERKQDIKTNRQLEALELIDPDFENVRTAWLHVVRHQQWAQLPAFLLSLWFYCDARMRSQEAIDLLAQAENALRSAPSSVATELALGRVLAPLGWFYSDLGFAEKGATTCDEAINILRQYDSSEDLLAALFDRQRTAFDLFQPDVVVNLAEEGLEIAQAINDKYWAGHLMVWAGAGPQGGLEVNHGQTRQFAERALALCEELGNRWGMIRALEVLSQVCWRQAQYVRAKHCVEQALLIAKSFGRARTLAGLYSVQARIARSEADYATAQMSWRQTLHLYRDTGYTWMLPLPLRHLAQLYVDQYDFEKAVMILATIQPHHLSASANDQKVQALLDELKTRLDPDRFAAAWSHGQQRTLNALVAEVLSDDAGRELM